MPAQAWPLACERFPFLKSFTGALVSGEIGITKPDPRFFSLLIERFDLVPGATLFVDDNDANVAAASRAGLVTHRFAGAPALTTVLVRSGLLPESSAPSRP